MKALVVGFGSIGQRHSRILKSMGYEIAVVSSQPAIGFPKFTSIKEAVSSWQPEYVVVATPTSSHMANLLELHGSEFTGCCLIEKPIFESSKIYNASTRIIIGVGYNLRFLPAIQRLRELLMNEVVLTASFYNGEYLPDWRPGRDYRTTSSARRGMGGGVLRDLSHEIDFIHYLIGVPNSISANVSNSGTLEIDTDDTVRAILKHENGCTTSLALSYLDRVRRREIIITTTNHSIYCNLLSGEILLDNDLFKFSSERDTTFELMHRDIANNSFSVACSIDEGMDVLRTLEAIEQSSLRRAWIDR